MINIPMGDQAITTSDAVVFTNLVNTIAIVYSITIQQPTTGDAKQIQIGVGTTATAANVKYQVTFAAGAQSVTIYPGWVLNATQTLNVVGTGTTSQAVIKVQGMRDLPA